MNIEEQANVSLDPSQDTIKDFVKRATAQEKVKQAQLKRKRVNLPPPLSSPCLPPSFLEIQ